MTLSTEQGKEIAQLVAQVHADLGATATHQTGYTSAVKRKLRSDLNKALKITGGDGVPTPSPKAR